MKNTLSLVAALAVLGFASAALADCDPACQTGCTDRRNQCVAACTQMYPEVPLPGEAGADGTTRRDTCEVACVDGEQACVAYCQEQCAATP